MPNRDSFAAGAPLSFVACLSDDAVLRADLLASPCLEPHSPHAVIVLKNCPSAAAGLNVGLERATHDWVVCVHQDVYLPEGWDRRMVEQLRMAGRRFGPIGIAGVYGVGEVIPPRSPEGPLAAERIGWVVDRGRLLQEGPELPATVATLDELLLAVPRNTPLRFDPALGFHLYGADICLQARERGLAVVAIGALCYHNSRSVGLPEAFFPSAEVFARKWAHRLPVSTPCVVIDRDRQVYLLGNTQLSVVSCPLSVVSYNKSMYFTSNQEPGPSFWSGLIRNKLDREHRPGKIVHSYLICVRLWFTLPPPHCPRFFHTGSSWRMHHELRIVASDMRDLHVQQACASERHGGRHGRYGTNWRPA